jgi:orotidine-5'-phosphate decarboxylase
MLNIHASGGLAMMQAAREALQTLSSPPLLLGVTVLTSLSEPEFSLLGVTGSLPAQVERLASLSQQAGLDGVVCSAHEAARLRQLFGPSFKLVTPGIRAKDTASHDQKRIMTPKAAIAAGSDCLVIGRCITGAPNPAKTVEEILGQISDSSY